MWDVGVERTVEVSGPDADRLIDMITCRDLTKCAVGQGKYMIVTAPDGGIVNDPVLLHVEENRWWMQLADSDAGLYALGVLAASGLNASVSLPDVHPMQVQGPLAAKTLEKLVGGAIYDIKYYWCERFDIGGIPVVISRTGWTAIPGFEVNLLDYPKGDALWDAIAGAGEEFGIKPIAPCEARRIEGGIFNYGSDMTLADTPLHVMGLERLVEDQPQDYMGKAALEKLKASGVDRKLVGIELRGDQLRAELSRVWDVLLRGQDGRTRDRCRVVPGSREEHRLRLGADRARRAGHRARRRDRTWRAPRERHGGDPVRRSTEAGARGHTALNPGLRPRPARGDRVDVSSRDPGRRSPRGSRAASPSTRARGSTW